MAKVRNVSGYGCVVWRMVAGHLEVLVGVRPSGVLTFPKGKARPAEKPRRAAARETFEELGVTVRPGRFLGTGVFATRRQTKRVSWYEARWVGEPPTPDGREFVDAVWIRAADAAAELTYPNDVAVCATLVQFYDLGRL